MISFRYGRITIVLLLIALVPTIIHHYIGIIKEDGLYSKSISTMLAGLSSRNTERSDSWIKATFDSKDWIERRYTWGNDKDILLFVARSYNLKKLYHHPEIAILRGIDFENKHMSYLPRKTDVPVHILRNRKKNKLAGYVLLYDGNYIKNPIKHQLLTSIELLFSPRKPMTLFMVYDSNAVHSDAFEKSMAGELLESALDSFTAQTRTAL